MGKYDKYISGDAVDDEQPVVAAPAAPANKYDQYVQPTAPTVPTPEQPQINQPFGELRPAEYDWRQTIKNKAQDALMALGASPYSARHVGGGVVDAASLAPPVGAAISGLDTGYYATRGQPAQAAANAIGMLPGATMANRVARGMPQRAIAPTERELGTAADDAYSAWRGSSVRYHPQMMDDVTNEIARTLQQSGANRVAAPKQWQALEDARSLKTQTGMTNQDFETLRQGLGGGADRAQIRAGEEAKARLEDYLTNVPQQHVRSGTPAEIASDRQLLLMGRGNVAAKKRSETTTGRMDIADIAEEAGGDYSKTLQNKIKGLFTTKSGKKELLGYTDEEKQQLRDIMATTMAERTGNAIETLGQFTPNPVVSGVGAGGLAHYFGLDPITAGAAAMGGQVGSAAVGSGLRSGAAATRQNLAEQAAANIRLRSPLAQQPGSSFGSVTDPLAMRNDIAKALLYPAARQEASDLVNREGVPYRLR